MIQIALALLLSAQSLLGMLNTVPNLTPEFKAQAVEVATQAIIYAETVIADSPDSSKTAQGEVFTAQPQQVTPITTIGSIIPVDPLYFTVGPTVTLVSTSTEVGIQFPVQNYNIHFETDNPATAEFSIYSSNKQELDIPATSFDFQVSNYWGMQVPFKITVTSVDGSETLVSTGVLKG